MAVALEVSSLSKHYGAITALDDVSISIEAGHVVGLIGPNGAGKTTLFECLAGLLPGDAGEVKAAGVALDTRARARHLFYLPDTIAPWPGQSVDWALRFAEGYFGAPDGRRARVVDQLALGPLLTQRIGQLSKGQRKRALLGVAFITPQPVLMVDEPFEGLDLRQTREVGAALRAHAAEGRTLFLSIHQIVDAVRVCDRFVLLSAGRVRGAGSLDELAGQASAHGRTMASRDLEDIFLALT